MHSPLKDAIERSERRKRKRERFIGAIIAAGAIAPAYIREKKRHRGGKGEGGRIEIDKF